MPQVEAKPVSASVADRVKKIKKLHNAIVCRQRLDTRDAIQIGGLLSEIKSESKRAFVKWVEENEEQLGFSYRTARNYMTLFEKSARLADLADMPLIDAYEAAGVIRVAALPEERDADPSRTLGEVAPRFVMAGRFTIQRGEAKVPHSLALDAKNWRQELLELLSSERDFERILKAGGIALMFK